MDGGYDVTKVTRGECVEVSEVAPALALVRGYGWCKMKWFVRFFVHKAFLNINEFLGW
jgi:hypothetical protein